MAFLISRNDMIESVALISPEVYSDDRGWFFESFKASDFTQLGNPTFSQLNRSYSKKIGTIRGLHMQIDPHGQGKLVQCTKGSIFDVAVDLREGSKTFGKWVSYRLDENNKQQLWIPEGFAHGFQTLEDDCEVQYLTTREYSREHERSILWSDPDIGIEWPIENSPILSEKDAMARKLSTFLG